MDIDDETLNILKQRVISKYPPDVHKTLDEITGIIAELVSPLIVNFTEWQRKMSKEDADALISTTLSSIISTSYEDIDSMFNLLTRIKKNLVDLEKAVVEVDFERRKEGSKDAI